MAVVKIHAFEEKGSYATNRFGPTDTFIVRLDGTPACDQCFSIIDVVFIRDDECGGVHSWWACRDCRMPPG